MLQNSLLHYYQLIHIIHDCQIVYGNMSSILLYYTRFLKCLESYAFFPLRTFDTICVGIKHKTKKQLHNFLMNMFLHNKAHMIATYKSDDTASPPCFINYDKKFIMRIWRYCLADVTISWLGLNFDLVRSHHFTHVTMTY